MRRRSVRSSASIFHDTNEAANTTYTDVFCGSSMRPLHEASHTVRFQLFGSNDVIERWPERCDEWCWHCRHPFDGVPASIPMVYDIKNETWQMKGIFCSFSCAKRYVLDKHLFNVSSVLFSMKQVALLFGVNGRIVSAPPLHALKRFGGHMEIEEFRSQALPVFGCEYPFLNYRMGAQIQDPNTEIIGLQRQPELPKRTLRSNAEKSSMYQTFLQSNPKRKRAPADGNTFDKYMKKKKPKKKKQKNRTKM